MITNVLINLLFGIALLLTLPIRVLSDVVLDANVTDAIADASVSLGTLSTVLPVAAIVAITALLITVELAILVWHGVNWIIRKIPTIN